MKKIIESDYIGQKYNRWTIISFVPLSKYGHRYVHCKCECGNEKDVYFYNIINGKSHSCGCEMIEIVKEKITTHGMTETRLYKIWTCMKTRCYNKNKDTYSYYGGRGIKICAEWLNDFQTFHDWAMTNGYADNLTIDRKDVNGDYEPENCRWITMSEQARNTRLSSKNTSGVKGVSYVQRDKIYRAYIRYNGIHICLGDYKTLEAAAEARKQGELVYW